MSRSSESGVAAVWAAVTMLFALGVAALAVDAGNLFSRAYDEQRASDFACLAAAVELPDGDAAARSVAAGYLTSNLDDITAAALATHNPNEIVWDLRPSGVPWVFEIDPGWGTNSQMRIKTTRFEKTGFARATGTDTVVVSQESYCELFNAIPGGVFPIGVATGFSGGTIKFDASSCTQDPLNPSGPGQCDYIDFPRFDSPDGTSSSSSPTRLQFNMWLGANQPMTCYDPSSGYSNPATTPPPDCVNQMLYCGTAPSSSKCNVVEMAGVAGNRASAAYQGLIRGEANGSSDSNWLGLLEFGDQKDPYTRRPQVGWAGDHSGNVWNTNLLHNSATCAAPSGCAGDDDAFLGTTYVISEYDCRDRRFVVLPGGDFIGPGASQQFVIREWITAYLVDPIPADDNGDGQRDALDGDPVHGNGVDTFSAIVVDLETLDPGFSNGSEDCPTSPFISEDLPLMARLIDP